MAEFISGFIAAGIFVVVLVFLVKYINKKKKDNMQHYEIDPNAPLPDDFDPRDRKKP